MFMCRWHCQPAAPVFHLSPALHLAHSSHPLAGSVIIAPARLTDGGSNSKTATGAVAAKKTHGQQWQDRNMPSSWLDVALWHGARRRGVRGGSIWCISQMSFAVSFRLLQQPFCLCMNTNATATTPRPAAMSPLVECFAWSWLNTHATPPQAAAAAEAAAGCKCKLISDCTRSTLSYDSNGTWLPSAAQDELSWCDAGGGGRQPVDHGGRLESNCWGETNKEVGGEGK